MFEQMKWTALLIFILLNSCGGENTRNDSAEINCRNKNNTRICDNAKDCSWNATALGLVTGNYECLVNVAGDMQCSQSSQLTCSSYKECGFIYKPLNISSCTMSWQYKIKCQDHQSNATCATPEVCNWNPQVFPNKYGDYECETASGDVQCFEISNRTDKCSSYKECGFTQRLPNSTANCSMFHPGIRCLTVDNGSEILLCHHHKECRWNPDNYPNKNGYHKCTYDHGELQCKPKYSGSNVVCSSYKECGFDNELVHVDKCTLSFLESRPVLQNPTEVPDKPEDKPDWRIIVGVTVGVIIVIVVLTSIGLRIQKWYLRRQIASAEVGPGEGHEMESLRPSSAQTSTGS